MFAGLLSSLNKIRFAFVVVSSLVLFLCAVSALRNLSFLFYLFSSEGFSAFAKAKILLELIAGLRYTMTGLSFTLLMVVSVLTALNIGLVVERLFTLAGSGSVKRLVVGGSFLGIIAGGCASCGVPVMSLLGVSSSFLVALPLGGNELSLLAILLLVYSIYISAKSLSVTECKV